MAKGNVYGRRGSPDRWDQNKVTLKIILNAIDSRDAELIQFMKKVPNGMVSVVIREFLLSGFIQNIDEDSKQGRNLIAKVIEIAQRENSTEQVEPQYNEVRQSQHAPVMQQTNDSQSEIRVQQSTTQTQNQTGNEYGLSFLSSSPKSIDANGAIVESSEGKAGRKRINFSSKK